MINKSLVTEKVIESTEQNIIDLYPSQESYEFIKKQQKEFENIDKNILLKYQDKFIYFENGEILDSDVVEENLVSRVMDKVGYRDIFITKV